MATVTRDLRASVAPTLPLGPGNMHMRAGRTDVAPATTQRSGVDGNSTEELGIAAARGGVQESEMRAEYSPVGSALDLSTGLVTSNFICVHKGVSIELLQRGHDIHLALGAGGTYPLPSPRDNP